MISAGMAANTALMKNIIKWPKGTSKRFTTVPESASARHGSVAARVRSAEIVRQGSGAGLGLLFAGSPLARLALSPQCSWKVVRTLIRHEWEIDTGHALSLLKSAAPMLRGEQMQRRAIVKSLRRQNRLPSKG